MARKAPHKGYFTKVEVTCDRTGVCCARRGGEEICGVDYKFPFADFNISKREQNDLDRGWPVRKLVPRSTWGEMVDAWGESGLFGTAKRSKRKRKSTVQRQLIEETASDLLTAATRKASGCRPEQCVVVHGVTAADVARAVNKKLVRAGKKPISAKKVSPVLSAQFKAGHLDKARVGPSYYEAVNHYYPGSGRDFGGEHGW